MTFDIEWARRVLAEADIPATRMIAAIQKLRTASGKVLSTEQARDLAMAVLKGNDTTPSGRGFPGDLAGLLEQARQRLALRGYVGERDDEGDPLVPARFVEDVMAEVTQLREGGADADAFPVSARQCYIDEDGRQRYSQKEWQNTSAENLRRIAAHAMVAAAICRSVHEVEIMTALVALELAEGAR